MLLLLLLLLLPARQLLLWPPLHLLVRVHLVVLLVLRTSAAASQGRVELRLLYASARPPTHTHNAITAERPRATHKGRHA
jgi:hypothetical protein